VKARLEAFLERSTRQLRKLLGPSIPETDKAVSVSKNNRLLGTLDNRLAEPLVREYAGMEYSSVARSMVDAFLVREPVEDVLHFPGGQAIASHQAAHINQVLGILLEMGL